MKNPKSPLTVPVVSKDLGGSGLRTGWEPLPLQTDTSCMPRATRCWVLRGPGRTALLMQNALFVCVSGQDAFPNIWKAPVSSELPWGHFLNDTRTKLARQSTLIGNNTVLPFTSARGHPGDRCAAHQQHSKMVFQQNISESKDCLLNFVTCLQTQLQKPWHTTGEIRARWSLGFGGRELFYFCSLRVWWRLVGFIGKAAVM